MRPRLIDDDHLLDQLLAAFADLGFDGASIRAICRHLGVSHNMVYQRYPSKDAAWTAAVDHAFARLTAALFAPLDEDLEPEEALRTLMRRWVDVTLEQPTLARIIHQESARPGPRFDYMYDRYIGPVQETARAAILEQQQLGNARPGPLSAAYFFLTTWGLGGIASSQALAVRAGADGDDPREAAYLAIDIVIRGTLL
ncbi:TetR/AcrR family transcriptional regulator [Nocardioides sp. WS12]|uniref:TetR/AcrR family transcriptional regulator n=1 Tax=Nocardioides sp. WS12 TaxID=2486272 RepID=UPI0015FE391E|nr:TetR/AcrR family transcriptional regulator [Nocardioides sp. WS12]